MLLLLLPLLPMLRLLLLMMLQQQLISLLVLMLHPLLLKQQRSDIQIAYEAEDIKRLTVAGKSEETAPFHRKRL